MDIEKKVYKYESFINDVLKEDLKKYELKLIKVTEDQNQYYELLSSLKHFLSVNPVQNDSVEPIVKSLMDIGCNFMMEAYVHDVSKIIIHVGLEYYLEFPLKDAHKYVESRLELLGKQSQQIQDQIIKIKARIKMCLIGIGELQNLN